MTGRIGTALVLLLIASALAGCLGADDTTVGPPATSETNAPHAVVALIDTGINPYHVDFRDDSPLALQHPSTYLPGYPEDAVALTISLPTNDTATIEALLESDQDVWATVEPNTLYWFPGTKIVGAFTTQQSGDIFDTGHGTMTASRAAGNGYSLCPECRIAMVQGFTAEAVTWASEQPWIDAQSNSWSPQVVFQQADPVQSPGLADAFEAAAGNHLVFGSAGNGILGKFGVIGHPSFTRSTSGPTGVVSVGGHDNGEVILWSGSWPHVVADACDNWAAVGNTLFNYSASEGGGTSSASPYAAGASARIVLEARHLLNDPQEAGVSDATFARGTPTGHQNGPLADGALDMHEVKTLLFTTATPRPVLTDHDGARCGTTDPLYNTYPIAWSDLPADFPAYALVGYGQISIDSVTRALAVLAGTDDAPDRTDVTEWHERGETLRDAYNDLPV